MQNTYINAQHFTKAIEAKNIVDDFILYPNPTNDELNIEFNVVNKDNPIITIYDDLGKSVFDKQLFSCVGKCTKTIDVSKFSSGIYCIYIKFSSAKISKKFIKY